MTLAEAREQIAVLREKPDLVYLDSTATGLKPDPVIEAVTDYYRSYPANIHRGLYSLSERATAAYEDSRAVIADWIDATNQSEIVFVRSATEGMNLIAQSLVAAKLTADTSVVTTEMEHHANFVPWQQLASRYEAEFRVLPVRDDGLLACLDPKTGEVDDSALRSFITPKTVVVAITALSNVLGSTQPIGALVRAIKKIDSTILVVVDAAQAVVHQQVSVQEWGCDAISFSGHKLGGPTGIGVVWIRKSLHEQLIPYQYGGDMIDQVAIEQTTFASMPLRLEAGTPHIAGAIGLAAAIRFLTGIGIEKIAQHEDDCTALAMDRLAERLPEMRILGSRNPAEHSGMVSVEYPGVHAHDLGQVLSDNGIAVRAGHHCAMPLHTRLGISASVRLSFSYYTTEAEVERAVDAIEKAVTFFQGSS